MVSGFVTSPCDQLRIVSGEASMIRIELNEVRRVRTSRSSGRVSEKRWRSVASGDLIPKSSCIVSRLLGLGLVPKLDVHAKALELLDQHVERLGRAGRGRILSLDDRLVDARPPRDVVRLHGEKLLERERRAIRLERPHLHLAESLSSELRLAAQRLLGDERIRPGRAGVDLVVHEVE